MSAGSHDPRPAGGMATARPLPGRSALITGVAGFIGFAVARALLEEGVEVVGVDNLCEAYYPRALKDLRLRELQGRAGFRMHRIDLCDETALGEVLAASRPALVVHLAAHAAVLPSFDQALDYVRSNIVGTQCLLEQVARVGGVAHLVYASTSSVYGRCVDGQPFREEQKLEKPISVYGASKVANEAMMQVYSDHYGLPVTGLRFFKVYGPWGRPDTVFFKFIDRVHHGLPVSLHNFGDIHHAFTYIDDVVAGVRGALALPPAPARSTPHPVYNLGNPTSQQLGDCLTLIERALGKQADRRFVELPAGDRSFSRADISRAREAFGYAVATPIEEGIARTVDWYLAVCAPLGRPVGDMGSRAVAEAPAR